MPLLDLLSAAGRRRRRVEQALTAGRLAPGDFERLLDDLQGSPPLAAEDFDLMQHLLEAAIAGLDRSWPVQPYNRLRQTLANLAGDPRYTLDVAGLYHRLALKSEELGDLPLARSEATRGYLHTRGAAASRTDCVLLLLQKGQFDEPARQIYRRFLGENRAGSLESQRFLKLFAERGHIPADTPAADVPARMPYNTLLIELLSGQAPYATRINLAVGHLILGEWTLADRVFREVLSERPGDKLAVHGQVVLAYMQRRYRAGVQIVRSVRPPGVAAKELDALEAFGQAATWLSDIQPDASGNPAILPGWSKALETPFELQHFVRADVAYVRGRLAGLLGDSTAAIPHLADALKLNPKHGAARHAYIQLMQIAGQWEDAASLLVKAPNAPEFTCLRLRQDRHDRGEDEAGQAAPKDDRQLAAPDPGVRLAAAQWAVLTGRAGAVLPWPGNLVFGAAEQTDAWLGCWLAALLARGEAVEARRLMGAPLFLRQPLIVQKTFVALAALAAGERASAATLVEEVLSVAPKYEVALRLSVLLAEKDPAIFARQLERLRHAHPKDHRATLQDALLSLNQARFDQAIDRLRPLTAYPSVAGQANFWLGLALLLRSQTENVADPRRDAAQATACFDQALAAGHPRAGEYGWICRAYAGRGASWTPKQAAQLFAAVPRDPHGALSNVSTPMTASTAALVAASTGRAADIFWGTDLLVAQLAGRESLAQQGVTRDARLRDANNLTEMLSRIADGLVADDLPDAKQGLLLAQWARVLDKDYPEHAALARRIADRILMKDVLAAVAEGRDLDGSRTLVENAVKENPDSLLPNLARLAILTRQGILPASDAAAELRTGRREAILAALQERVLLDGRAGGPQPCPPGARAFLFAQRRTAGGTAAVLDALAARPPAEAPSESLAETARCLAVMNRAEPALAFYEAAARHNPSEALVDEYRAYLCYVAAQWKAPGKNGATLTPQKVQELLVRATALAAWPGSGQLLDAALGAAEDVQTAAPAAKRTGRRKTLVPAAAAPALQDAAPGPPPAATLAAAAQGSEARTVLLSGLAGALAARAGQFQEPGRTQ